MGKTAFLFSGQGAQYVGMGKSFADENKNSKRILQQSDQKTGGKMSGIAFGGNEQQLNQTINTQPCMFTMEAMALAAVTDAGLKADGVAGFSLGEYGALLAAGVFDFSTGLDIVSRRGEYMEEAARQHPGSMAAVLGLPDETVSAACDKVAGIVQAVNYNCEKQVVIAGEVEAVKQAGALLMEQGGKVVPLSVSGGFHSKLMDKAAKKLGEYLAGIELNPPQIELFWNVSGESGDDSIKALMQQQVKSPVLWKKTIENMIQKGYDVFIEIGPGKTLSGFMRRINRDVLSLHIEDMDSLGKTMQKLEEVR